MKFVIIFLIAILSVPVIIFISLTIWAMRIVIYIFFKINISTAREESPEIEGEKIKFASKDGIPITGYFVYGKENKGETIIFCHEVGAGWGSWHKYAYFLPPAGYNVLTFDFRGHGNSGNKNGYSPNQWVTNFEMYDIAGAMDYLRTRSDVDMNKIGLIGISRGSGIGICAAKKTGLIKAIVADSCFATSETLNDYITKWVSIFLPIKKIPLFLNRFLTGISLFCAQLILKERLPSIGKALRKMNDVPVFFIHGEKDNYISVHQAKRLYEMARSPKLFWVIPKARHNESVLIEPIEYKNKVTEFFKKYI